MACSSWNKKRYDLSRFATHLWNTTNWFRYRYLHFTGKYGALNTPTKYDVRENKRPKETEQGKKENKELEKKQDELSKKFDDLKKDIKDIEKKNEELAKPQEMEKTDKEQKEEL